MRNGFLGWLGVVLLFWPDNASAQQAMTFRMTGHPGNYIDAEWIAAEGTITPGTADRFRAFIASDIWRRNNQIIFNSTGGNLGAALELGRAIRELDMRTAVGLSFNPDDPAANYGDDTTLVPGTCESACAWAFMGGVGRTVSNDRDWSVARIGQIGIHRFYQDFELELPPAIVQASMGELVFYTIEMGIDPGILSLMATVPSDEMHYLTEAELGEYRVENTLVRGTAGLALSGDGLAWVLQVTDTLGRAISATSLYCRAGGESWVLRHRVEAPDNYQVRSIMRMPRQPEYEIGAMQFSQGGLVRLRPDGVVVGSDLGPLPESPSNFFALTFGPDLMGYAGQDFTFTLDLLRQFPNLNQTLPDAREFNVLRRTCPSKI